MKNPSSEDQRTGITVRMHQEIVKERIEPKDNKGMCTNSDHGHSCSGTSAMQAAGTFRTPKLSIAPIHALYLLMSVALAQIETFVAFANKFCRPCPCCASAAREKSFEKHIP